MNFLTGRAKAAGKKLHHQDYHQSIAKGGAGQYQTE